MGDKIRLKTDKIRCEQLKISSTQTHDCEFMLFVPQKYCKTQWVSLKGTVFFGYVIMKTRRSNEMSSNSFHFFSIACSLVYFWKQCRDAIYWRMQWFQSHRMKVSTIVFVFFSYYFLFKMINKNRRKIDRQIVQKPNKKDWIVSTNKPCVYRFYILTKWPNNNQYIKSTHHYTPYAVRTLCNENTEKIGIDWKYSEYTQPVSLHRQQIEQR